jgi:hypothetical protein
MIVVLGTEYAAELLVTEYCQFLKDLKFI